MFAVVEAVMRVNFIEMILSHDGLISAFFLQITLSILVRILVIP